jgi:uncharacterized membrane-anchored protein
VAQLLGVSEEDLINAFKTARQDMVNEFLAKLIEEGKIDEEEASRIKERWEQASSQLRQGLMFRHLCGMDEAAVDELLAKLIEEGKIDEEEASRIKERWEQAGSQLQQGLMFRHLFGMDEAAVDELLAKLIEEGKIDEEQAGKIKEWWNKQQAAPDDAAPRDRTMWNFRGRRMIPWHMGMPGMRLHRFAN